MGIFLPLLSIPCVRPAATCLALCVMLAGSLRAQTGASPVFKSYTPPRPGAIVEQSDVTYQLWHTFDLTRRAGAGDVLAQQELAVRYLTGRGVKADTVRGAFWTISAAAQNMPPARFNLGILSSNGWGVAWNPFEAYDQFLWCAERGMPESQYILGTLLLENLVVPRDWNGALYWLQAAADSGYAPARELVETMRRRGEAGSREPVDTPGTVSWDSVRTPAPGSTLPWAPVFLDFEADTGTSVDDALLIADLLRDASSDTLRSLGLGDSARRLEEAGPAVLDAVERSAEAGSPEALTLLARCRERGAGMTRDTVLAATLYVRAVRLDSPRSPELLMALLGTPGGMAAVRSRSASGDPVASFVLASLVGLRLTHPLLKTRTWITDDEAVRLLRLVLCGQAGSAGPGSCARFVGRSGRKRQHGSGSSPGGGTPGAGHIRQRRGDRISFRSDGEGIGPRADGIGVLSGSGKGYATEPCRGCSPLSHGCAAGEPGCLPCPATHA
jgi:TPR repeat protein